ncbi:MAG: alpha/beta hydrolase [Firmicutes bacterium]|nr:alpha/beta hydrolase [Bacillota bacterium]
MSKVEIQGKNIYYETYGEGEPLIILNGIMMSTASWIPFKDVISDEYKLVVFDMVDQGQSDKMDKPYTQDLHVDMLFELIEKLELGEKVHLFGISYGAEVAMKFAIKYQEKLHSLILSNCPYKTTSLLRYIANRWADTFKTYDGIQFYTEVNQHLYAEDFYEKHMGWLEKQAKLFDYILPNEWYDGMIRLLESGDQFDVTNDLHRIKVPTLIISASEDRITPTKYQREIEKKIENSRLIIVEGAAHVLPYEKPYAFLTAILGFLKVHDKEFNLFK